MIILNVTFKCFELGLHGVGCSATKLVFFYFTLVMRLPDPFGATPVLLSLG